MQLLKRFPHVLFKEFRYFSTVPKNIQITTDNDTGITTLSLQRPPVNTLNTELLIEFSDAIDYLEQQKSKGMILTSGIPHIFSGGLDLMEFYKADAKKLEVFWSSLQNSWLKLYTSSFPTVAVINGHSPAGGCMLAMSCEYRVMVGSKYTIGLNEAKIGIPAPFWFMDVMRNTIGPRKAEISLTTATLHTPAEALAIGLVDDITEDINQAQEKTKSFFQKQHSVDAAARGLMKKVYRKDLVDKFLKGKEDDLKFTVAASLNPKTQQKLELYIQALKKK